MEKYYKITEAAELLSVARFTIYRWKKEGKIKVVTINGNPRIAESELKKLVKESKNND